MSNPAIDDDGLSSDDHWQTWNGPWVKLRKRVEPLLGDLETHLGRHWHATLDRIFSRQDLNASERLMRWPAPTRWLAVQRFQLGGSDDFDLEIRCVESFPHAVAFLVEDCRFRRMLPTSLTLARDRERLDLWLGAERLATIGPMNMRRPSEEIRRRAEGTVIGLRKFDDVERELLKRARRWPGLSELVMNGAPARREGTGAPFPSAERSHLPVPKEWLFSARVLCARCGHPEPNRSFLEQVAAAAFDAPSWNHLAGAGAQFSSLPWFMQKSSSSEEPGVVEDFYSDGIDAVADLFSRAPSELTSNWSGAALAVGGLGGISSYWLERKSGALDDPLSTYERISIGAVESVFVDDQDLLELVARAIGSGDQGPLEQLFGIGQSKDSRMQLADSWEGEELIASEGAWRFTLAGKENPRTAALMARRFDADGSCVERAGGSAYKTQLRSWNGHHVLCADYDGSNPVAIIEGLSRATVEKLAAVLPDQRSLARRGASAAFDDTVGKLEWSVDLRAFRHLAAEFERRMSSEQRRA
ncbi:hypothetical protein QTI17_29545 [Variovorax sp. J31P179]|uniref:hypothetical protein n=1 Tax=Variovorax sp. J31P179 TaxID=3053508 RepID=UPI0025790F10|nr:hypothetical protein [Variovorax sp. J31P179]MDM0084752.1 hypothetical protein [Variovorax sp. J31P179]